VIIDDTTQRMVEMLREASQDEPEFVDPDIHTGHYLEEIAMVHYAWERKVGALRLLIGVRLTNLALEEVSG